MTEPINQQVEEDPQENLQKMKDLTAQWADYFNGILLSLDSIELLTRTTVPLNE